MSSFVDLLILGLGVRVILGAVDIGRDRAALPAALDTVAPGYDE